MALPQAGQQKPQWGFCSCAVPGPVGMSTGKTAVKIENPNLFSIGEGFGFFVFFGKQNAAVAQQ